jgi:chorismate-pyruvate lyase
MEGRGFDRGDSPWSAECQSTAARLLFPLSEFYAKAGLPLPAVEPIVEEALSGRARDLLMHDEGMTRRLERRLGGPIGLRVLATRHQGPRYARQVALTGAGSDDAVALAAVLVHLPLLPAGVRAGLLEERIPLGYVLDAARVPLIRVLSAVFRLRPDALVAAVLPTGGSGYYGRRSALRDREARPVAELVEIVAA